MNSCEIVYFAIVVFIYGGWAISCFYVFLYGIKCVVLCVASTMYSTQSVKGIFDHYNNFCSIHNFLLENCTPSLKNFVNLICRKMLMVKLFVNVKSYIYYDCSNFMNKN